MIELGSRLPQGLDFIFRSRFTVSLTIGLRMVPIAALIFMRRLGSSSPSWANAAAIHAIPLPTFVRRIIFPYLLPSGSIALLLISFFALADIGTTVLLRPPGHDSLPVAIFTVMANAPESLVASLCVLYIGGMGTILFLLSLCGRRVAG